jgi:hypothetical protein
VRLENIKLEGLSSPNASHLDCIQTYLSVVYAHWGIVMDKSITAPDEADLLKWLRAARPVLERYIQITAKIDDGSYFTYLRYKYRNREMKLELGKSSEQQGK